MSEVIKKRLAVVGSRTFNDKGKLYDVLTKNYDRIKLIISGGAKGADSLAVEWAIDYGIPYLVFPALWRDPFTGVQNKGAGFKRNVLIVEQADVVMAFWDGKSAGTAHTIEMAKQRNKPVRIIKFDEPTPKEPATVDFKTGKIIDPPGGLCCSMPTCEHQEWPEGIETALRKLVFLDESALVKECGVSIDKIRPVLETVEQIIEGEHGYAEAMLGEECAPCGCSGMPPCCSGHMELSVIPETAQVIADPVPEDDSEATL